MADDYGRPPSVARWSLDLRGTAVPALVQVRRWASRTLRSVDDDHLSDVLLVATELVTNAYDHGQGPLEIRMSHTVTPCRVRIEVDDSCLDRPFVVGPADARPRGRGMLIVDKLAADWGVREHTELGTKTVWAEMACEGIGDIP